MLYIGIKVRSFNFCVDKRRRRVAAVILGQRAAAILFPQSHTRLEGPRLRLYSAQRSPECKRLGRNRRISVCFILH